MTTPLSTIDAKKSTLPDSSTTGITVKSVLRMLFELIVVLTLVMGFFLFLLRVLNEFFPEGSAIQDIINRTDAVQIATRLHNNLLVKSNRGTSELAPAGVLVATLSEVNRDVRSKRADSIAWNTSRIGMSLYNQDAIQTFSRSSATIKFDRSSQLHLGPDTLVIIKRMEEDVLFSDKHSSLLLVEGELSGSLKNTEDSDRHIEILTAGARAHIRTRDNADETVKFKVSVNADQSSTIAILSGSADIMYQGVTQKIASDQALVIRKGGQASKPKPLPLPINLKAPKNNASFYYRDIPDKINFSWRESGAQRYRLIISRDAQQKNIILDEKLDQPYFTHENLTHGVYYWRVSGIDKEGSEGKAPIQRKLTIIQDIHPPTLSVQFPDEDVTSKTFIIRGKSEPGANIYINNQHIKANPISGEFEHKIIFSRGVNVILVEAADSAGNISYLSRLISMHEESP